MTELLPHRGAALMLRDAAAAEPGAVLASAVVPASHPLSNGVTVPAFVGVELGAQAAAALEALTAATSSTRANREGRLVRIRDAEFLQPTVPVDIPLTVRATLRGAAPPVALYDIEVAQASHVLVRGEITTYCGGGTDGGA